MSFEFAMEFAWFILPGFLILVWAEAGDVGERYSVPLLVSYISASPAYLFFAVFWLVVVLGCFLGDDFRLFKISAKDLKIGYLKKMGGLYGGGLAVVLPLVTVEATSHIPVLVTAMVCWPLLLWVFYCVVDAIVEKGLGWGIWTALLFVFILFYTANNGLSGIGSAILFYAMFTALGFFCPMVGIWAYRRAKRYRSQRMM